MKKYNLLMICLVLSLVAMAQKPVISFDEKSYDFGKVKEEDGKTQLTVFSGEVQLAPFNSPEVVSVKSNEKIK